MTSRRVAAVAVFAMLSGGVAAAVATVGGHRDAEASAVASLAPLTPEVSSYFLTPVVADFQGFMTSQAAVDAAAKAPGGGPGVFSTRYDQDSSDITISFRAAEPSVASRGLAAGVRAGFDHVISSQVQSSKLAMRSADRRVEDAQSALLDFEKQQGVADAQALQTAALSALSRLQREIATGTAGPDAQTQLAARQAEVTRVGGLVVQQQILRTDLDQALKQRGDAATALSLASELAASLPDVAVLTQQHTGRTSPMSGILRAALLGLLSGAAVVAGLLWIRDGLGALRGTNRHVSLRTRRTGAVVGTPADEPFAEPSATQQVTASWPKRSGVVGQ